MLLRKYLFLLIILISGSCIQAQTGSDTICINTPQFRKIYAAALQKRMVDSLLVISDQQVKELQIKVNLFKDKDTATVNSYSRQIVLLQAEIANYILEKKEYERLLKWEKFKRKFWTGLGAVTIGVVGVLYLTK